MIPVWIIWSLGATVVVYMLALIRTKLIRGHCHSKADLTEKTAIITGANTGIGYQTALDLAKRNARVIIACRNEEKGRTAAQKIRETTGNLNVIQRKLDLSSMKSVREFCAGILREERRLDILINNAGIGLGITKFLVLMERKLTEDGFENTFATNHLGPFLLTNLLSDLMKKSAPARIVNVSSIAHVWCKLEFDNLNGEKQMNYGQYGMTKLANILFSREISRRLEGTGVTSNSLHPGTVDSEFFTHYPSGIYRFFNFMRILGLTKTVEEGAQTSIYCAVSKDLQGVSGKYFSECKVAKESNTAKDDAIARKLWEISERLTSL